MRSAEEVARMCHNISGQYWLERSATIIEADRAELVEQIAAWLESLTNDGTSEVTAAFCRAFAKAICNGDWNNG